MLYADAVVVLADKIRRIQKRYRYNS